MSEEKKEVQSEKADAPAEEIDYKKEFETVKKQLDELNQNYEEVLKVSKEKEKEAKDWENKYYTVYADMANTRKQVEKENQEFKRYAISSTIRELIPVLDSFDMALKNEPQDEKIKNYVSGFKMIHSKFLNSLKQLGVEIINPKIGEEFNPHLMEAFSTVEGEKDNLVAETFLKGYKLHEHLLRSAGVIITKKPVEANEPEKKEEADKKEDTNEVKKEENTTKEDK